MSGGKTTVTVTDEQKASIEAAQQLLKETRGIKPTQGEAVKIACNTLQEVEG